MNKVLIELWDFFKKNFAILLVGALFLIFYGKGCNNSANPKNTSDTTTVITQQPQPIVIMPPYQPQQSGTTVVPVNIPSQYNPSTDILELTKQYNDLIKNYLSVKTYRDSIELRDTSGLKVGVVDLTQIVSENTLKSTQPTYKLNFPLKTVTITNTVYPKPKNQVYIGVGLESLINTPSFNQAELGILLKNKKDNIIGFAGTYNIPSKSPGIKLSFYKKISL